MLKSKKLSVIAAAVLCVSMLMSSSAFASDAPADDFPVPYAPICTNCYEGQMITTVQYGRWTYTGNRRVCTEYRYGTDEERERINVTTTQCNHCGVGGSYSETETEWECFGHSYKSSKGK